MTTTRSDEVEAPRTGVVEPDAIVETHLARMLVALRDERATGVLDVAEPAYRTSIYVSDGSAVFAEGGSIDDSLGRLLMRSGRITSEQYQRILERMTDALVDDELMRFGEVAIELGILRPDEVMSALAQQVKDKIHRCMRAEEARWIYRADPTALEGIARFPCRIETVVFEALVDPEEAMRWELRLAPFRDRYPVMHHDGAQMATTLGLTAARLRVLRLCDGSRTLSEVLGASPIDRGEAVALLSALLLAQRLELRTSLRKTGQAHEALEALERAHPHLVLGQVTAPSPAAVSPSVHRPAASEVHHAHHAHHAHVHHARGPTHPQVHDRVHVAAPAERVAASPAPAPLAPAAAPPERAVPAAQAPPQRALQRAPEPVRPEPARSPEPAAHDDDLPPVLRLGAAESERAPEPRSSPQHRVDPEELARAGRRPAPAAVDRLRAMVPQQRPAQPAGVAQQLRAEVEKRAAGARPPVAETRHRLTAEQSFELGRRLYRQGKIPAARVELARAAAELPDSVEYRLWASFLEYLSTDDADLRKAIATELSDLLIAALKQDRRMAFAHYVQGRLAYAAGDSEVALKAFRLASTLDPDDVDAKRFLRLLQARSGGKK